MIYRSTICTHAARSYRFEEKLIYSSFIYTKKKKTSSFD